MDELRLGVALRSARVARRLRQCDVAVAARVSDATVSRIERGRIRRVSVGALVSVAAALEIQLRFRPVARSGDLDRIVNARHTALVEAVIARLTELDWRCQAEVSFSKWGERGSIDILALHPATGALLVIEAKTEIVDVGEILSVLDRKRRLALEIARDLGWDRPRSASVALIVADARTNRRRAAAVRSTLRSALPDDGRRLRGVRLSAHVARARDRFLVNSTPQVD